MDEALRIGKAVASALDYAHRQEIIHRDIKPANILLHDGQPVIADFGIALAVSAAGGGRMTETGLSLGTPHYMSPEQASADRELTPRSDIYALGCVTYEMLAGTPPFSGPSAQSVLMQILTEEPKLITAHRKSVPSHVAQAVAKSLEKLPADRFTTADEFARALDDPGFRHTAAHATASASGAGARTWFADPRSIALSIAVLVLIVGWALRGPTTSVADARPYVFTELPPEGTRLNFSNYSSSVAVEPDGSAFYFVDDAADRRIYRRAMERTNYLPFGDIEQVHGIVASQEGRGLAVEVEGALAVVTATGVSELDIGESPDIVAGWLEDGYIYFIRFGEGLLRITPGGTEPEMVHSWDGGGFFQPIAALDDGRLVGWGGDPQGDGLGFLTPGDSIHSVVPGIRPLALVDETLLVARNESSGAMLAMEIDPAAESVVRGPITLPFVIAEGGRHGFSSDLAVFQVGSASLENSLVLLDREGNETAIDAPPREYLFPRFSPDGNRLAVEIHDDLGGQIWVLDFGSGALNLLTNTRGDGHNTRPLWYPDGSRVLYARNSGFYSRRADGGGEERLEWGGPAGYSDASWLDDDRLIFEYEVDTPDGADQGEIGWVEVGTSDPPVPLFSTPAEESSPLVSPDRRWVAYISDVTGQNRLYVTDSSGEGGRFPISTGTARNFSWGTDSSELLYQGEDGFMRAEVTFEPTLEVRRERLDFADAFFQFGESASFSVHPVTGELLFIKPNEAQHRLTVIVNFAEWVWGLLESSPAG